ncbi:DUF1269 domain-containing protein [Caballeronia ptereochthonis]|uniref:DUF1269 domain-containing protein n=1 Tax=Caballeronia ptereochthonis TaxID=1777144 RepID=UPI000B35B403|nr:DUF1269 domain-containing protein [Caballeronia ptereochthonis]
MPRKLIVIFFEALDHAEKAFRELDSLEKAGDGFTIDSAVLIQRESTGRIDVLRKETESLRGAFIGVASCALVGALGGPVGAAVGLVVGAAAEGAEHALAALLERRFIHSIEEMLARGKLALILEAKETTPYPVDKIIQDNGADAFRRDLFPEPRGSGVD